MKVRDAERARTIRGSAAHSRSSESETGNTRETLEIFESVSQKRETQIIESRLERTQVLLEDNARHSRELRAVRRASSLAPSADPAAPTTKCLPNANEDTYFFAEREFFL